MGLMGRHPPSSAGPGQAPRARSGQPYSSLAITEQPAHLCTSTSGQGPGPALSPSQTGQAGLRGQANTPD